MKHLFSSDPNLAVTKAEGTLPIPVMYGVNSRAQKGSPDLCSSASPTALSAKQKNNSRQDCKERLGSLKSPFILRHNGSLASQLEPYTPKRRCCLAEHPWESLSPLPVPHHSGGPSRT